MEIRKCRKESGLKQKELAEKMGVAQPVVSQWERGTKQPTADKLPKLAKVLGCKIDDLF